MTTDRTAARNGTAEPGTASDAAGSGPEGNRHRRSARALLRVTGPRVRLPGRELALVLDPDDMHRVLDETPETFYTGQGEVLGHQHLDLTKRYQGPLTRTAA